MITMEPLVGQLFLDNRLQMVTLCQNAYRLQTLSNVFFPQTIMRWHNSPALIWTNFVKRTKRATSFKHLQILAALELLDSPERERVMRAVGIPWTTIRKQIRHLAKEYDVEVDIKRRLHQPAVYRVVDWGIFSKMKVIDKVIREAGISITDTHPEFREEWLKDE